MPMRGPGGKGRAEVGVVVSDHQEEMEGEPASDGPVGGAVGGGAAGGAGAGAAGEDGLAKAFNSSFRWISSAASGE